jgi:acyl carrier protein
VKSRCCGAFALYEIGFLTSPRPVDTFEFTHLRIGKERRSHTITVRLSTGGNNVPDNRITMTREEFLLGIDEVLGLSAGTLRGDERLDELPNWDSTALIELIILAETAHDAQISFEQVVNCSTVADLLRLAQVGGSSS